jgi:hypothetical protein
MNKSFLIHMLLISLGLLPLMMFGMQIVALFFSLFVCATAVVADKILA